MQLRLLATILVLTLLVFCGSTFVEQIVSASTDTRTTTQPALVQKSPCANGKESGLPLPTSFLPARLPEFQTPTPIFSHQPKISNSKLV